jgi:hypothetical protein
VLIQTNEQRSGTNRCGTLTFLYSGLQSSGKALPLMVPVAVMAVLSLFPMSLGVAAAVAPAFFRTCVGFNMMFVTRVGSPNFALRFT